MPSTRNFLTYVFATSVVTLFTQFREMPYHQFVDCLLLMRFPLYIFIATVIDIDIFYVSLKYYQPKNIRVVIIFTTTGRLKHNIK